VSADGAPVTTVAAGDSRTDLMQAGIGNHAFNVYALPVSLKDGRSHSIRAVFSGTNTDLIGSPKTFQNTCGTTSAPPSGSFSITGNVDVPGVTLTAGSRSAISDASGGYIISGVSSGNVTLTPSKTGCTFSPPTMSFTVSGNVSGKNFTPSCSRESEWNVPIGSDFGQRRGCFNDSVLGALSKKRAESCSNGFSTARIRMFPDGSGSKIIVEFLPYSTEATDQAYYYRVTLPWAAKVTNITVVNGQPVADKKESETLRVIGDELKDKVLGPLAFPLKLFFADTKHAGDPPFLTYASTNGLLQQYYPYEGFDGHFQRTFPGLQTHITINLAIPYDDLAALFQSMQASFYVGGNPQNELLVEGFRP
jgi:hypothetical protein